MFENRLKSRCGLVGSVSVRRFEKYYKFQFFLKIWRSEGNFQIWGQGPEFCAQVPKYDKKICPSPPKYLYFSKIIQFPNRLVNTLPTSPGPLFNIFQTRIMPIFVFLAKVPNMEIQPQTSKILEKFETYNIFQIVSPIHFQRARNVFSIYL